jgi:hypothetical protein
MILALLAAGVLYSPWLMVLFQTLQRTTTREVHLVAGNAVADAIARPVFWFVSFTFGEAFPLWAVLVGLATGPVVLWIFGRSVRLRSKESPECIALLALATVIAYAGTVLWVSLPFTPARLLFLLPFYLILLARGLVSNPRATALALCGVAVVWFGGLSSYFQRDGFLNKGYLIPFAELASHVEHNSQPSETLVLIDGYNTDPKPLVAELAPPYRCLVIHSAETASAAAQAVAETTAPTVWFFGNTHDIAPGRVHENLKAALRLRYNETEQLFVPYSELDHFVLRRLGWRDVPTHHYQMLQFEWREAVHVTKGFGL